MKTSEELYDIYNEVIIQAKNSIRELLEKQPDKTKMLKEAYPWIIQEYCEGVETIRISGATIRNGLIELITNDTPAQYVDIDDIIDSECLVVLQYLEGFFEQNN